MRIPFLLSTLRLPLLPLVEPGQMIAYNTG